MIKETRVENGRLRGIQCADPRIIAYKGVPFAAPPVGKNRWRAPQPAEGWEGVLDCARFKPISLQVVPGSQHNIYEREWNVDPDIEMSEDCLYLNVWTPAKTKDEKLPVFVWFFGGGLQEGNTQEMEFNGERIARRGIVVVTVNYRLNVFGFLAHPWITAEAPDFPTNFGNLDQRYGLLWVQRNIAAFGGDPDNVTIGGQSAGAGSVQTQLASPLNKGLFHKAVIMSGTFLGSYGGHVPGGKILLSEAEERGKELFDALGFKSLEEARAMPAEELNRKYIAWNQSRPMPENAPLHLVFETTVDGNFCTDGVTECMREGRYMHMPLIIGGTLDEFHNKLAADTDAEFVEKAGKLFGKDADGFLRLTDGKDLAERIAKSEFSPVEAGARVIMDAARAAGRPEKIFYYQFDADIPGWDDPGAFHSVDLWFFFETLASCWRPFTGEHYDLAEKMCSYWANFFKTGDPNGCGRGGAQLPEWKSYNESGAAMRFIHDAKMGSPADETELTKFLVARAIK